MVHVRLVLLLTVVVAGLLVGCSTRTAGTATPATDAQGTDQPETSSQDAPPEDGAPEVEDPLEASRFEDNPCLALDAAQRGNLALDTGTPVRATLGKACLWENESTRSQVQITFYSKAEDGLSAQYRAQDDGKWAYFEELPAVDGFPAVARDITDNRENGTCPVVVGISDELAFETDLRLPKADIGTDDPCDVAAEVAGMAVKTIKTG